MDPDETITEKSARLNREASAAVLIAKLAIGGAALAIFETLSAKLRIFRVPEFLATAFLLAVIGILVDILLRA